MGGNHCRFDGRQSLSIRSHTVLRLLSSGNHEKAPSICSFSPRKSTILQGTFAKETYRFKERTDRCHTLVKILPLQWCCRFVNESMPLKDTRCRGLLAQICGNTLRPTATHNKRLQRTATHCNALQTTAAHCNPHTPEGASAPRSFVSPSAAHCTTLQQIATHPHPSALQHYFRCSFFCRHCCHDSLARPVLRICYSRYSCVPIPAATSQAHLQSCAVM